MNAKITLDSTLYFVLLLFQTVATRDVLYSPLWEYKQGHYHLSVPLLKGGMSPPQSYLLCTCPGLSSICDHTGATVSGQGPHSCQLPLLTIIFRSEYIYMCIYVCIYIYVCFIGAMKMGNVVPREGSEPTSLAFQAGVLISSSSRLRDVTTIPTTLTKSARCLRGQCRLLHICILWMDTLYIFQREWWCGASVR